MPEATQIAPGELPPGNTQWLGATPDKQRGGTHFVFYTGAAAEGVTLCLFDKPTGVFENNEFELKSKEEVRSEENRVAHNASELRQMLHIQQTDGKPDPATEAILHHLPNHGAPDGVPVHAHYLLAKLKDGTTAILSGQQHHLDFKATHITRIGRSGQLETSDVPANTLPFDIRMDTIKVTPILSPPSSTNPIEGATIISGQVIGYLWNGFAKGVTEGALYGFRVSGPYNPAKRQFFDHHKLLVDPCAKAVTHEIHTWDQRHFHHNFTNKEEMSRDENADIMPKARVVDWQALQQKTTRGLKIGALYPHADTDLLEMHVKGATILDPDIPKPARGTYKALAHPSFIKSVHEMSKTSLELMPVESFGTDAPLAERGKKNYWGYMTMAPMAPYTGYAASDRPEEELAHSVRALKLHGLETILDIVPNHTLESGSHGPILNLRGMDDTLYLHNNDYTGTGNTRDYGHPINRRMLLEELQYWQGLGVAGFRLDLATVMGREHGHDFDPDSPMMKAMRQDYGLDYGLKDVKFYGEPWDLGPNGYQIGRLAHYPQDRVGLFGNNPFTEWDGKGRDTLRDASLNPDANIPRSEIIRRISGSSDLYSDPQGRVIKFSSHDGMTPADLVTYRQKHNEANGEGNRDGNEGIANFGIEGPTDDPVINSNRQRAQRFAIALVDISQGVPMMVLGHERGHSQGGNSNAYCQDNATTYTPWGNKVTPEGRDLMAFTQQANAFRKKHFSLRRATHFSGQPDVESGLTFNHTPMKDVTWLDPLGNELKGAAMDWPGGFGMMLSGDPGNSPAGVKHFTRMVKRQGRDEPLLILVNPTMHDIEFTLPDVPGVQWKQALNSLDSHAVSEEMNGHKISVGYHSLIAFEGQRTRDISATSHDTRTNSASQHFTRG